MNKTIKCDICIIGAGSAGLSIAAGASQMGAQVVLVEHHKMGGECLNAGCVPSKSLINVAHIANIIRQTQEFGIIAEIQNIDYQKVHDYVHHIITNIEPHDSAERFTKLGVTVLRDSAKFISPKELKVNDILVKAKYYVIATGSSLVVPPIAGLADTPYLTNETIFDLKVKPKHLIVIGGGPVGSELAQTYRLLGTKVTLIQHSTILSKDDPNLVDVIRRKFVADGINLYEYCELNSVKYENQQFQVNITHNNKTQKINGSHLLVATGRKPNIEKLNLDKAKVVYTKQGITADRRLRTNQKHIFAIGDVTGPYRFTHMASYQAGIVIRNALFRMPAKVNYNAVPWATFTTPELAHVGMQESEARNKDIKIRVLTAQFADNDRAQTENDISGFIKVVTKENGKILGASIVGHNASELIYPWVIAVQQKLKIKSLATTIVPYPTRSEISKAAAYEFYKSALFSSRTRKLVKFLLKL